ncbi:MAG: EamA family transporter [Candidatus Omnitrophica bacterium]|nr:EamA family transporter [Candidatus Omnitrophota bacterium]MDD5660580.1 EamA family transporter [Candidatus Omnitrophota bacterium]
MFKKKVTLKILVLLIASDLLETTVHFFFKKSALSQGSSSVLDLASALVFLKGVLASPFLWAALFTVVLIFIIWSTVLAKIDLSVAVPIASFSYILVPVVSVIFLHEHITILRWGGILLILAGVILVSISSKERIVPVK